MQDFTRQELAQIKKLTSPAKIQDFLNALKFNFEQGSETLSSPLATMRRGSAHCFEGALLGAYLLSRIDSKHKPSIVYLQATKHDYDHVIAPFRVAGLWGALSKTNHAVLRYREPVYKNLRELVMSYFHEYFLNDGTKTLRAYSAPLDLNDFEDDWVTTDVMLWGIDDELNTMKHFEIVPKHLIKKLRKADVIEREAGKIMEYRK